MTILYFKKRINELPWDTKTRGQLVTSVSFVLLATVGEDIVLDIPGFGELAIISDSGDDGRDNTQIANDEGNTKRSKGEFVGVRFLNTNTPLQLLTA